MVVNKKNEYKTDVVKKHYEIKTGNNLLINSNFMINSRARVNYSKGYTVDRWRLFSGNLKKLHNSIILYSDDTVKEGENTCFLRQYIENASYYEKLKLTLSCNVTDVVGKWYMQLPGGNRKEIGNNGINVISAVLAVGAKDVRIFTTDRSASICINWIKLEVGEEATEFIAPSFEEELLRCNKYTYFFYKNDVRRAEAKINNQILFRFELPIPLVRKPVLRVDNTCFNVQNSNSEILEGDLKIYNVAGRSAILAFTPAEENAEINENAVLHIEKDFFLDAEVY